MSFNCELLDLPFAPNTPHPFIIFHIHQNQIRYFYSLFFTSRSSYHCCFLLFSTKNQNSTHRFLYFSIWIGRWRVQAFHHRPLVISLPWIHSDLVQLLKFKCNYRGTDFVFSDVQVWTKTPYFVCNPVRINLNHQTINFNKIHKGVKIGVLYNFLGPSIYCDSIYKYF